MRIVTWNINSVRLRLGLLLGLMAARAPDVVCLQETKCPDAAFPAAEIAAAGYTHQHIAGMKGYNGVAILSRQPLDSPQIYEHGGLAECRHISARVGGLALHNLYVPAGGYEADPASEKFAHKLAFVEEMARFFPAAHGAGESVAAVGDLNIAPGENDVWSHRQMLRVVSHTSGEVERLRRWQGSLNFVDTARAVVPEGDKSYTWWSYRARDWDAADRGRRLDHVWLTQPLATRLAAYDAPRAARGWERPSDHVPVIVDLKD